MQAMQANLEEQAQLIEEQAETIAA